MRAYLVWVERKARPVSNAAPARRKSAGPVCLQPIADAVKLMSKQLIVPAGVDRTLFRVAPC